MLIRKQNVNYISDEELLQFGILGMKWGVRRYQNPDGTLTKAGMKRYHNKDGSLTKKGQKFFYNKDGILTKEGKAVYYNKDGSLTKEGIKMYARKADELAKTAFKEMQSNINISKIYSDANVHVNSNIKNFNKAYDEAMKKIGKGFDDEGYDDDHYVSTFLTWDENVTNYYESKAVLDAMTKSSSFQEMIKISKEIGSMSNNVKVLANGYVETAQYVKKYKNDMDYKATIAASMPSEDKY